ncbi:ion channel [Arachidicoccus soli]|uniref:Transporter n=1 Tax=Arachidicoccus soli TaxID=2341117 RepID=A0A386HN43_9BACT|nr:ion channel [Arachidicoccus soli]AYD47036.1 transporter [Arachidicoccus soli]
MALRKKINPFSHTNNDTGFGSKGDSYGGRFINKDGSYNLHKQGIPLRERFSIYQAMLDMPRWKFICTIVLCYIIANVFYTLIYLLIGINEFQGFVNKSEWGRIKDVFFFSTETFTTVGYGRMNPVGDGVNLVAAIEAMTGFLSFALATGLLYGRFSKAKAHISFSQHALIAPYKEKTALMFRLATHKNKHSLTDVNIKVNLSLLLNENGESTYKFYDLPLERNRVDSLMMNWTVVHPIDENSPLLGLAAEDMQNLDFELYILVRGFDDVYSSNVLKRTSYTFNEVIFNAKFTQMYHESEDGKTTILDLDKLGKFDLLD